jgi:hypothetical protein
MMVVSDKQTGRGRPERGLRMLADVFLQLGRAYGAEKSVPRSMIQVFPERPPMIELLKTVGRATSPAQLRRSDLYVETPFKQFS